MKVYELFEKEIDIDVYDNVCEELGVAFCGPMELTEEGKKHFAEALNYDVDIVADDVAIVDVDGDDWEDKLFEAIQLFESAAGMCCNSNYEKWFKE